MTLRNDADLAIAHRGAREAWAFEFGGSFADLQNLSPDVIADALGLWGPVADAHMDRIDTEALSEFGFAKYLSESCGFDISPEYTDELDSKRAPILMVYSDGLGDSERLFAPEPPFVFLGKFTDPESIPTFTPLESEAAEGQLPQGKPAKSDARISGMVATIVLIFLALFVFAFVWIAG